MKFRLIVATFLMVLFQFATTAKDLSELKILYVGSERPNEFIPYLEEHFTQVEARDRKTFNPTDAGSFDVVILDWPQGPDTLNHKFTSALGPRERWGKPTVL